AEAGTPLHAPAGEAARHAPAGKAAPAHPYAAETTAPTTARHHSLAEELLETSPRV
ncbi:CDP-alcohol phosphatidyltransferase family protein, partial [Streptomyces sp. SID89]|nr:CDP-alcohol phosphatidyltransferase family protein [Streptomyces sp. SID89]